jgi:hypothetical protein
MDLVLDVDAFRAWLLAHDEGSPVGIAYDIGCCPLARFLSKLWADQRVQVTPSHCSVYSVSGRLMEVVSLPAWAGRFVILVDSWHSVEAEVFPPVALRALVQAVQGVE